VTVTDNRGESAQQKLNIVVTGTNDQPDISGAASGNVTEDLNLPATGTLTSLDKDTDQSNTFKEVLAPTVSIGGYGTYTIDQSGHWVYNLNNALAQVQALRQGDTVTDTFNVSSGDGSKTQTVTINIHGTNDLPVMGSANINMTAQLSDVASGLTLTGKLDISDVDNAEAFFDPSNVVFDAQSSTSVAHGSFAISNDGYWTYSSNNNYSTLNSNDTFTDVFKVSSIDGTVQNGLQLTVKIKNTPPESNSTVLETDAPLTLTGTLVIPKGSQFTYAAVNNYKTDYGTLSIDTKGN